MATRRSSRVRLSVATPSRRRAERRPLLPWWLAAFGGILLAALAGWLALVGVVVLGWLSAMAGSIVDALRLGTQVWLLAHGVPAHVGDMQVSLVPLGLTGLLGALVAGITAAAARQAVLTLPPEEVPSQAWRIVRNCGALPGVLYAALVALGAIIGGSPSQVAPAALGGLMVGVLGGTAGAWSVVKPGLGRSWPAWLRSVPRAMGVAALTCLAGGAACIGAAFIAHAHQMATLERNLGADVGGGLVLLAMTLAYLPTLVLWGVAYIFGAGFQVGAESLVAPGGVNVGLLPALPPFGAVPAPGAQPRYLFAWLAVGVLAGVLAGLLVVRARRRARADETSLAGGLAGVGAGLLVTLCAAVARGGIGTDRLAVMGPRLTQLAVLAPTTMGIAGLAAGLVLGLLRRPAGAAPASLDEVVNEEEGEDEPTRPVARRPRQTR